MSAWKQKVFWTSVEVEQTDAGYCVTLDGRAIKTPAKVSLAVPTPALAQELSKEWAAQKDEIDAETLPLTRLLGAAIDKISVNVDHTIGQLAQYAGSDLVCYRADRPDELVDAQEQAWGPLVAWLKQTHGATLNIGTGVMPIPQPDDLVQKASLALKPHSFFELAAIHQLITLSGSFVIGLATASDVVSTDAGWDASRVDEIWQIAQWGRDEDAEAMAQVKKGAFVQAYHVLSLLKV